MIWLTSVTFELGNMINHRRICTFDEDRRGLGLLQIVLLLRAGNLLHAPQVLALFYIRKQGDGDKEDNSWVKIPRTDLAEESNVYFAECRGCLPCLSAW